MSKNLSAVSKNLSIAALKSLMDKYHNASASVKADGASVASIGTSALQNAVVSVDPNMFQNALKNSSYIENTYKSERYRDDLFRPPFDPNQAPAYQITLSALMDLWVAKWGDVWVDRAVCEKDEFWGSARARLYSAGKFENTYDSKWSRLLEK